MKSERLLNKLAEQARRETVPKVNVTGSVLQTIAAQRLPANGDNQLAFRTLAWTAGVAVAAAAIVMVFTAPLWQTTTDPVTEILIALQI